MTAVLSTSSALEPSRLHPPPRKLGSTPLVAPKPRVPARRSARRGTIAVAASRCSAQRVPSATPQACLPLHAMAHARLATTALLVLPARLTAATPHCACSMAVQSVVVCCHSLPPTVPPRFCPEGAGVPSDVQEGYYTTPLGVAAANRESEAQCEAGYFCHNGVRSECGEFQWCAAGVSSPTVVKPGEYSTPTSAPATRREAVVQCEAGYYCTEGVRQPCPAGVFTAQTSQTKCSDKCTAGYVALLCRRVVHPAPVVLSSRPNSSRVQLLLYWRRVYWHAERLWRHRSVLPRGLVGSHFRRGWVLHG